jgi:hypothetical protein
MNALARTSSNYKRQTHAFVKKTFVVSLKGLGANMNRLALLSDSDNELVVRQARADK